MPGTAGYFRCNLCGYEGIFWTFGSSIKEYSATCNDCGRKAHKKEFYGVRLEGRENHLYKNEADANNKNKEPVKEVAHIGHTPYLRMDP